MGIFSGLLAKFTGQKAADIITSVGDVVDKFVQTPEEKAKAMQDITNAVNAHMEKMAELQNAELETLMKDNESARNREIQIATSDKAPKLNKLVTPILALSIIGLTFGMWWAVLFRSFGNDNKDVVLFVLGSLSTLSAGVVSYYFGSSSSSQRKQDQIENMLNK